MKTAQASIVGDRTQIFNFLNGREDDADVDTSVFCSNSAWQDEHNGIDDFNCRMKGFFALVFWHRALAMEKPTELGARKAFMLQLNHLARAIRGDMWRRSMSLCLAGCTLKDEESIDAMTQSMPPRVLSLRLSLQHTGVTDTLLERMVTALPEGLQMLSLDLSSCDISDAGVMALLQNIQKSVDSLSLVVSHTQVSDYLANMINTEPLHILRERADSTRPRNSSGTGLGLSSIADPHSFEQLREDRWCLLESMLRTRVSHDVDARIIGELVSTGQTGERLKFNRRRKEFCV